MSILFPSPQAALESYAAAFQNLYGERRLNWKIEGTEPQDFTLDLNRIMTTLYPPDTPAAWTQGQEIRFAAHGCAGTDRRYQAAMGATLNMRCKATTHVNHIDNENSFHLHFLLGDNVYSHGPLAGSGDIQRVLDNRYGKLPSFACLGNHDYNIWARAMGARASLRNRKTTNLIARLAYGLPLAYEAVHYTYSSREIDVNLAQFGANRENLRDPRRNRTPQPYTEIINYQYKEWQGTPEYQRALGYHMPYRYYALVNDNYLFIILDSNSLCWDLEQLRWLNRTYQQFSLRRTCTVVMHHPIRSSGKRFVHVESTDIYRQNFTELNPDLLNRFENFVCTGRFSEWPQSYLGGWIGLYLKYGNRFLTEQTPSARTEAPSAPSPRPAAVTLSPSIPRATSPRASAGPAASPRILNNLIDYNFHICLSAHDHFNYGAYIQNLNTYQFVSGSVGGLDRAHQKATVVGLRASALGAASPAEDSTLPLPRDEQDEGEVHDDHDEDDAPMATRQDSSPEEPTGYGNDVASENANLIAINQSLNTDPNFRNTFILIHGRTPMTAKFVSCYQPQFINIPFSERAVVENRYQLFNIPLIRPPQTNAQMTSEKLLWLVYCTAINWKKLTERTFGIGPTAPKGVKEIRVGTRSLLPFLDHFLRNKHNPNFLIDAIPLLQNPNTLMAETIQRTSPRRNPMTQRFYENVYHYIQELLRSDPRAPQ